MFVFLCYDLSFSIGASMKSSNERANSTIIFFLSFIFLKDKRIVTGFLRSVESDFHDKWRLLHDGILLLKHSIGQQPENAES